MTNIFKDYGIVSCGILNISPCEVFDLVKKGALIVDVREENLRSFKSFDVPELIYLPKSKLAEEYENLPSDSYMIFADTVGLRSKEAVIFLKEKGFEKIANMAGGIVDWERDGLPVSTDIATRLSGSCMCQLKSREGRKKTAGNRQQARGGRK
ncbi:MAG: rhodanese-like domain-containing protein [Bacteroidia bacterium]|nr:rhodanese-like domain-containing protein [Bacteroidia bacterium]